MNTRHPHSFITCQVAGHRGAMHLVPENTIPSFVRAMEIGVNELEFDLRVSREGNIVVIHDATLDRTTNGTGTVSDHSFEELRRLDAGNGEMIPTFTEVLDATGDLSLQVEIKDARAIEPMMVDIAHRPADRARLAPTSFNAESVQKLASLLPEADVGFICKIASPEVLDEAEQLGARRVLVGYATADEDFVAAAHERGLRVDLWPIDTPEQVRRLMEMGANGFTTDDPRIVAEAGYRVTQEGLVSAS